MFMLETAPKSGRADGNPDLALRELTRYQKLKSQRMAIWDDPWQRLSDYYLPNMSDINTTKTEGTAGWGDLIYDTTGIEDARICTTGHANWATPSAEPWFAWTPPKSMNMDENDDGSIWCGMCTEIALDELSRSNYYSESGIQYKNRVVFGTGQLHIEQGEANLINCMTRKIATYCVARNSEGMVDTIYSEFKYSARQAKQEWGESALKPARKIYKALTDNGGKGQDAEFVFVHVIRPRSEIEREPGRIDGPNKPFASIYIALEDKVCVKEGGYDEMPDSVTRFDDWGTGSVWGYSPAFETLPNVRELNFMVRFQHAQVELQANPRILTPIKLFGQMDLRPGGVTPYDPNAPGGGKPEEWVSRMNLQGTETGVQKIQEAVHRMFYTDVFKAMQEIDVNHATAYGISQVMGEKLEQLSPMFGRLITEKTGPDLKRIFGILFRAGRFPKPPRSMYVPDPTGRKLRLAMPEVTYTSRLALALMALQNKATMDTLQFITEVSGKAQKPEWLDNWDWDSALRAYAINQGMSPRYERPMQQVISLRQQRAQLQSQDRAMAMAEQAATAAGKLGKAPQALQDSVSDQIPKNKQPQAA
jgi:hypothetical protein